MSRAVVALTTLSPRFWPVSARPASIGAASKGITLGENTYESVQTYYGKVLSSSKDLKTSACTTASAPTNAFKKAIQHVPNEILERFYGCGNPVPTGIRGLHVLDLGSGSGRDVYAAAVLVGEDGFVTGIDMTDEQLEVARSHVDEFTQKMGYAKPNIAFKKGMIEFLAEAGVEPESVDLVISNCVVNLSPNKELVIKGVYDALREGGEFYFSDVYCDRRLPQSARDHEVMVGECLGGALYIEDFKRICHSVGFLDPRELSREEIKVNDPELKALCGNAKFYSITYRCFKLAGMETLCEDYGEVAIYKGTIEDFPNEYSLDSGHVFEAHRPKLVCGNTASMVGESWLRDHFEIIGNRNTHFGLFGATPAAEEDSKTPAPSTGGGCC